MRDKKHGGEDPLESRKRRYTEAGRERARERFNNDGRGETRQSEYSGLGMETTSMRRRDEEEDDDDPIERRRGRRSAGCKRFVKQLLFFYELNILVFNQDKISLHVSLNWHN
jgi:hypothetical protein